MPKFVGPVDIEFTRTGELYQPLQLDTIRERLAGPVTDALVLAHGWSNDKAEANQLYQGLVASLNSRAAVGSYDLRNRKFLVIRIFWPSKRFAEADLIPGGGASGGAQDSDAARAALIADISGLVSLFDGSYLGDADADVAKALRDLAELVPQLEDDEEVQDKFARTLRSLVPESVNEEEELFEDEFYRLDGPDLLLRLSRPFKARARAEGGAAEGELHVVGGAAALGNVFRGMLNGARNLLNLFTYYEMKERAGLVGSRGLSGLLDELSAKELRLHLVGHSFGARAVVAALASAQPKVCASSVTLLQAAFSHWAFARLYDGQKNGFFRAAIESKRLRGPMIVTHTANDWPVGVAYPIASRLRRQIGAGIGDASDPYGGIGRNGAQKTSEVCGDEDRLRPTTQPYTGLSGSRIFNLESSAFISGHSAVRGEEVAHAILSAMTVVP